MKVEVLNPQILIDLYKNHGEFACECYATDTKYAERVGKNCQHSGHMSGSRCEYIKFKISGVDRGTAEQALRHEIGTRVSFQDQDNYTFADLSELIVDVGSQDIVKNMASFRYIDKDGFEYETPKAIKNIPAVECIYKQTMEFINDRREMMKKIMIEEKGVDPHVANEAANFVLPRATTTSFTIGFTPEALIHFCHKRLCTRAQEFIRRMAILMKIEVEKISPEFAKELIPHCQHLLWCPEGKKGCGAAPSKEDLKNKLIQKEVSYGDD